MLLLLSAVSSGKMKRENISPPELPSYYVRRANNHLSTTPAVILLYFTAHHTRVLKSFRGSETLVTMSFDLLPDHIILDILELLWPNYATYHDPLPHIARSSKRLNHLATPLLYREIQLVRWTQEVSLLKSFLKNPELGYVFA